MQVFREYYPTNKEFVTLECVWKTDKFVLVEKTHKIDVKGQDGGLGDGSIEKSVPRYWTIESFLGGNDIQGKILFWFLSISVALHFPTYSHPPPQWPPCGQFSLCIFSATDSAQFNNIPVCEWWIYNYAPAHRGINQSSYNRF